MTSSKCVYFDKGYCRNKDACTQKHPQTECNGSCEDKRICPKRHRILCKNGDQCIFVTSESCKFLHKKNNTENTESDNTVFKSTIKIIADKLEELTKKEEETVHNISNLKKEFKCTANKLERLLKSQPDDIGEWMTTVVTTQNQVESMEGRVEDIEEEFSNKLEQHEKDILKHSKESDEIIIRFEKKLDVLEAMINQLLNVHEGQVSSEDSHSSPNIKGIIEIKDDKESKTANQTTCYICQKILKSKDNLQTHDKKFHMKRIGNKGLTYKCDQCSFTSTEKNEVHIHINEKHKKM